MKKILLPFLALMLLFVACDTKTPEVQITGTVVDGDLNNKMIYLHQTISRDVTDSAKVVDNKFTLKAKFDAPTIYNLSIDKERPILIFVDSAAPVKLTVNALDFSRTKVEGRLADLFAKFNEGMLVFQAEIEPLKPALNSGDTLAMVKYQEIEERSITYYKNFVLANSNNLVGLFLLRKNADLFSSEEMNTIKQSLPENLKNNGLVQLIYKISEGSPFIDLKMKTPEGTDIAISDFAGKGKYVLLDFWASWCGPCRRENPNVVAAYNKYKDLGFEIVGISMDKDVESWKKGIEEDKITWPQMSDLKQWQSQAIEAYGISGIPFTVLLDKEGKIIAKNLRGEELDLKLASLFAK